MELPGLRIEEDSARGPRPRCPDHRPYRPPPAEPAGVRPFPPDKSPTRAASSRAVAAVTMAATSVAATGHGARLGRERAAIPGPFDRPHAACKRTGKAGNGVREKSRPQAGRGGRDRYEGRKASTAGPDRPTHEPPPGQCLEREIPAGECLRAGGQHDVGKPILGLARRLESKRRPRRSARAGERSCPEPSMRSPPSPAGMAVTPSRHDSSSVALKADSSSRPVKGTWGSDSGPSPMSATGASRV